MTDMRVYLMGLAPVLVSFALFASAVMQRQSWRSHGASASLRNSLAGQENGAVPSTGESAALMGAALAGDPGMGRPGVG